VVVKAIANTNIVNISVFMYRYLVFFGKNG